ncbi:aldehyde dehydrogenase (NADP(+)) [Sphingomonas sp.]
MALTGEHFIAGERTGGTAVFHAKDPAADTILDPGFAIAGDDEVHAACASAEAAFAAFAALSPNTRADLLDAIADNIAALGTTLVERAMAESGLPQARLTGEQGRTVGQLRLFATELREGSWMGIRVDPALPERQPLPRPDLRTMKVPLGPVAVFGASNFPLAFSVAGGDTASALAAGCPVVVKGHPAHPGTSELVAGAIVRAVKAHGLPGGVFSLLQGTGNDLGAALVRDPRIRAVGFTGSRSGGLALMKIAAERPEPIPVYAEMSAVNPVLLMPGALAADAARLGDEYVASLTLGAGQFCTNPGLVLAIEGPDLDIFVAAARTALADAQPQVMLTDGIHAAFENGVARLAATPGVDTVARGPAREAANRGQAALFSVPADLLTATPSIVEEVFGASSVLVRCRDAQALADAVSRLEGQLTATVHFTPEDEAQVAPLLPLLARKAGRLIANGWPTGVEVSHAMVHGGPFPATSDGRSTSVGTLAIDRFLRPICWQGFPDTLLPGPLRPDALAGTPHRLDGRSVA